MQDQSFGFILEYQDKNIYCEVFREDDNYTVVFDGKYQCDLELDETQKWVWSFGNDIPEETIIEIGLKIDEKYA